MRLLIKSEWERIFSRRKTLWLLAGFAIYVLILLTSTIIHQGGIGKFDEIGHTVPLNALNYPSFLLSDLFFVLVLLLIPVFVTDQFNGEIRSGVYRMVLLRPYSISTLLWAKWLAIGTILFLLVFIPFLLAMITGQLVLPQMEETIFYYKAEPFSATQAFLAQFVYLLCYLVILFTLIAICSFLSLVLPNTVLVIAGYLALLLFSFYLYRPFMIFIAGGRVLFEWIAIGSPFHFLFLGTCFFVSNAITWLVWSKRDWVY